jgi:hypothetical protein
VPRLSVCGRVPGLSVSGLPRAFREGAASEDGMDCTPVARDSS